MKSSLLAVAAFAASLAFAGETAAQTGARERLLIGNWACTTPGAADVSVQARFDEDRAMTMIFLYTTPDNSFGMSATVSGWWSYDSAADAFSQTVTAMRLGDFIVESRPVPREEFPGGEDELVAAETEFVELHRDAPFRFTRLTERELVLTDAGGDTLNCTR